MEKKTKAELIELLKESLEHIEQLKDQIENIWEEYNAVRIFDTITDRRFEDAEEFLNQFVGEFDEE